MSCTIQYKLSAARCNVLPCLPSVAMTLQRLHRLHMQGQYAGRPIVLHGKLHAFQNAPRSSLLWRIACPRLVVSASVCSHHSTSRRSSSSSSSSRASRCLSSTALGRPSLPATPTSQCRHQQLCTVTHAKRAETVGLGSLSLGGFAADDDSDTAGPAFKATLGLLEWPRLCEHVADFASTAVGKRMCRALPVPEAQAASEQLLQEAKAVIAMEYEFSNILDFGGIASGEAESAIRRADKGGMVGAGQFRGLVSMLQGADKLKRQLLSTARQRGAGGRDGALWPLVQALSGMQVPTALMRDVLANINEEGEIADNASEQVRMTRAKVRGIQNRLSQQLKAFAGEVSERGGRMCVAAPAGTKINNGVMLGATPGGGMVFIEPAAVVGGNNDLMAARAEAMAAEEAVLWDLSGRLMGCLQEVQTAFDVVMWLDVTAAKARFGMWLGGVMPTFVPWEDVFHSRSGSARRRQARAEADDGMGDDDNDDEVSSSSSAASGWALRLRGLQHPLLQANFLKRREQLEKEVRLSSGKSSSSSSGRVGSGSGNKGVISSRNLGTRREVVARRLGGAAAGMSATTSDANDTDQQIATPEEQLSALKPPRPIDIFVRADTTVVVITGPNTGGKTAAMKALGLAVCMAKAGMPVPCASSALLPCYSAVLADIGDEQSLTANLSTFSGHLKRIQGLRAEADGRALLLLDELGTGTDPTEGAALGVALLRRLVAGGIGAGALTIATTHHSVMTALKSEDARFENASVEFDEVAMAPTYKLLWGVPGRSNALNIAERLGLDQDVVLAARERLGAGTAAANEAIAALEAVKSELEREDMAAWAVEQELVASKRRIADLKRSAEATQQALTARRSETVFDLYRTGRAVLKVLKAERKQRARGLAASQSETSKKLDAMLGPNTPNAAAADAWQAWEALGRTQTSGSTASSSATTQPGTGGMQLQPGGNGSGMSGEDAQLIGQWQRLLAAARQVLAAYGGSSSAGSSAAGSEADTDDDDDDDLAAEIAELDRRQRRKSERAAAATAAAAAAAVAQQGGGAAAGVSAQGAAGSGDALLQGRLESGRAAAETAAAALVGLEDDDWEEGDQGFAAVVSDIEAALDEAQLEADWQREEQAARDAKREEEEEELLRLAQEEEELLGVMDEFERSMDAHLQRQQAAAAAAAASRNSSMSSNSTPAGPASIDRPRSNGSSSKSSDRSGRLADMYDELLDGLDSLEEDTEGTEVDNALAAMEALLHKETQRSQQLQAAAAEQSKASVAGQQKQQKQQQKRQGKGGTGGQVTAKVDADVAQIWADMYGKKG